MTSSCSPHVSPPCSFSRPASARSSGVAPRASVKLTHAPVPGVSISRRTTAARAGKSPKLYTPHFHKPKDLGWWLALGAADGELLALKRIGALQGSSYSTTLTFAAPLEHGRTDLALWLVADAVRGLDRRTNIPVEVTGKS